MSAVTFIICIAFSVYITSAANVPNCEDGICSTVTIPMLGIVVLSPFLERRIGAKTHHAAPMQIGSARYMANDDDVPESCRNLTYCTVKPANYPEMEFDKMFKNYKLIPQPKFVEPTELIANRFGESESTCHSVTTYEPLYKVRRKRDDPWHYVIQAPKPNVVRIRMETCSFPGEKCFGSECASSVVQPICKQVVNTWEIPVFEDGKPTTVSVDLPVCCKCAAESVPFTTKFGQI